MLGLEDRQSLSGMEPFTLWTYSTESAAETLSIFCCEPSTLAEFLSRSALEDAVLWAAALCTPCLRLCKEGGLSHKQSSMARWSRAKKAGVRPRVAPDAANLVRQENSYMLPFLKQQHRLSRLKFVHTTFSETATRVVRTKIHTCMLLLAVRTKIHTCMLLLAVRTKIHTCYCSLSWNSDTATTEIHTCSLSWNSETDMTKIHTCSLPETVTQVVMTKSVHITI